MRNQIFAAALLLGTVFGSSCMRKEIAVPAHDPGNVQTATVDMGSNYRYQVYYNLELDQVVSRVPKSSWDLAFEATADGYRVALNGSKIMFALPVTRSARLTELSAADTFGFGAHKRWDNPNGNLDSTAIGDWRAGTGIYFIDRGYDETGKSGGLARLEIEAVDAKSYKLRFGLLNSSEVKEVTLQKDSSYNFVFLNLETGATIPVEPPKADWDLVFTQYTHTFYAPEYQPYLVTGCLLNRWNTQAAVLDSTQTFETVDFGSLNPTRFTNAINTIGYDWKTFDGSTYTTNAKKTYGIRDAKGFYYKLHFTDFINGTGAKGNPKWEYQKL
jgi:hypothetical protein